VKEAAGRSELLARHAGLDLLHTYIASDIFLKKKKKKKKRS